MDASATKCVQGDTGEPAVLAKLNLRDDPGSWPAVPGYRVIRHLGSGAMGDVYAARDGADRAVALKVLTDSGHDPIRGVARVAREVAALSAVDHPNVVRLHAHGSHQGRTWLAMELVEGRDLDQVLAERGTLAEADALRVALQVARGLAHVHATAGIIHRDIKPANLLLEPGAGPDGGDAVKIIDFGLSKAPASDAAMTREGMVVGTPMYMAPEQIRGQLDLGPAADIYALGATLAHLLTGRPPFAGVNAYEIMRRHLQDPPPDVGATRTGLHSATRQLVATAMAKDPAARQPGWAAFIAETERALAQLAADGQRLRLLRVDLAPGTTLRLRRETSGDACDPFKRGLPARLRRHECPREVERLVICARPHDQPAAPATQMAPLTKAPATGVSALEPHPIRPRRTPSPAALALLHAYRMKVLALPATRQPQPAVLTALHDQYLLPIALLLAATAAWLCTWWA